MDFPATMKTLEHMGTAQNRKIYGRHGAGENLFGVSFANLKKLKKKIKVNQPLAEALWATGNTDAQTLAIMIADPTAITAKQADVWLREIDYSLLASMLAGLVAKSAFAKTKLKKWTKAKREQTRQAGYDLLSSLMNDIPDSLTDAECQKYIYVIEEQIHSSANRARHAMNMALIAIALAKPELRKKVEQAARRIGKVEVDHGETSCKTPEVTGYIKKALASKRKISRTSC